MWLSLLAFRPQLSVVSFGTRQVRSKTHDVVIEAVRRSGYTPNSTARNLRTRRTMNVLVVAPRLTNPVFAEILRGVDDELTQSGYGIIIGNLDNRGARGPVCRSRPVPAGGRHSPA